MVKHDLQRKWLKMSDLFMVGGMGKKMETECVAACHWDKESV